MKNAQMLFRSSVLILGLTGGLTSGALHAQPQEPQGQMQRGQGQAGQGPQRQQQMLQWLQNMTPQQLGQMLQRVQAMTPEQRQQTQQFLRNMTPEQLQQMQGRTQPLLANLTPQQRQQIQGLLQTPEQKREAWVRQVMVASGFTGVELQDAVIAFMQAQEKVRAPLRTAASALSESLLNPALTDEQLKTTWAGFRELVAKDRDRYAAELAVLDGKIKYSTRPRLEMLLGVIGVVGQETATLGGIGAVFPESGFGSGLVAAVKNE